MDRATGRKGAEGISNEEKLAVLIISYVRRGIVKKAFHTTNVARAM